MNNFATKLSSKTYTELLNDLLTREEASQSTIRFSEQQYGSIESLVPYLKALDTDSDTTKSALEVLMPHFKRLCAALLNQPPSLPLENTGLDSHVVFSSFQISSFEGPSNTVYATLSDHEKNISLIAKFQANTCELLSEESAEAEILEWLDLNEPHPTFNEVGSSYLPMHNRNDAQHKQISTPEPISMIRRQSPD